MGGYGSGGHNKTHRQIENYYRIDSFSFYNRLKCDKYLYYKNTVEYRIPDGNLVYDVKSKTADIVYSDGGYFPVELSRVPNIDGKSYRMYFHCPYCGKRVRYLYRRQESYMCRECAKLNYKCQQESGMDEMRLKMHRIVEKKLGYTWWRREHPNTEIYDLLLIPKPRYMRWEKYEKLMREMRQLQKDYARAFWLGMYRCSFVPDDMMKEIVRHINDM